MAHPGGEAGHLCTDECRTQGAPELTEHLAHPVVSDGSARLSGQVQHMGLRNCTDNPVQVGGHLSPVTDNHLEEVAQALQSLLAGPHLPPYCTVVQPVYVDQLGPVEGGQGPRLPVRCLVPAPRLPPAGGSRTYKLPMLCYAIYSN